ncbi:hypothetical protein OGAPHI_006418 [Ogataea philodendri]|uniref:RING-Gid-type domain-containing protein n=1 Tax=Ogataea philodendri TaxID=1378263 RepID=A0A9P8NXZ5_9ASCO|nr:uncharacterized protein OGAPHI_006418 [Ogataea philodendri]KAH3661570.1 hypothetical protein OGAPHI_006418 [Ogataea philodendri]
MLVERQKGNILSQLKLIEMSSSKAEKTQLMNTLIEQQKRFNQLLRLKVAQHNEFISRLQSRILRLSIIDQNDIRPLGKATTENVAQDRPTFYKEEINLMIIDFLLKTSYLNRSQSQELNAGVMLAKKLGLEKQVDYDVILQGLEIYNQIKIHKNLKVLMNWCTENKRSLKSIQTLNNSDSSLEFETYFQSFIENIKLGKLPDALEVANSYLINFLDINARGNLNQIASGAALLCWNHDSFRNVFAQSSKTGGLKSSSFYDQNVHMMNQIEKNVSHYNDLLEDLKWTKLANFFLFNFNSLYGIEQSPELLLLLSIGSIALKTRSCAHEINEIVDSEHISFESYLKENLSMGARSGISNECPICSTDLFELTSHLPFSHQVKSNIYDNSVMLPNGNVYQYEKLMLNNWKLSQDSVLESSGSGSMRSASAFLTSLQASDDVDRQEEHASLLGSHKIVDPLTGQSFRREQIVKVYPT